MTKYEIMRHLFIHLILEDVTKAPKQKTWCLTGQLYNCTGHGDAEYATDIITETVREVLEI